MVVPTNRPVAKRIPIWRLPPINWMMAPGMAQMNSHLATSELVPASMVVANVLLTGANRSWLKYLLARRATMMKAMIKESISE